MTQNEPVCTSCQRHRAKLRPRKSKLNVSPQGIGMPMFLCTECFEKKYEPRWVIILVGRRDGFAAVQNYLIPKRYVGPEILASDLVR